MSQALPPAAAPAPAPLAPASPAVPEARLDAERLDVYRVAGEFQALAAGLLSRRGQAALRDQLDRASVSIVLNIAEGAGRSAPADKARFYAIARGSATECAALLDVLLARGLVSPLARRRGRALVVRIVQMLTKLAARLTAKSSSAGAGAPPVPGCVRATAVAAVD